MNDLHTALDQKLACSFPCLTRLLCTFYSRIDSGDKDSASSAVSGRMRRMTGNITAIVIFLLMWAYYSGKWGKDE